MRVDVFTTDTPDAWAAALAQAGAHDFYHEAWYHALAERHGGGRAELLVAGGDAGTFALPLLFRTIDGGLEDATSVYGYAGPVGCMDPELATACAIHLRARGTVSLFSRLHPLLDQAVLDENDVVVGGATTSVDLTVSPKELWSATRSGHRNGINRLRREGFTCERRGMAGLDTFIAVYEATMRRLNAGAHYFFPRDHYEALVAPEQGAMELFVVVDPAGTPAAVGLFSLRCGIAQYHLSGTTDEHRHRAPTTLLIDEARTWAREQGATVLHLGGGVGGARDSLFDFKSGFGTGRHTFRLWERILRPDVYRELDEARRQARGAPEPTFFPSYRAP